MLAKTKGGILGVGGVARLTFSSKVIIIEPKMSPRHICNTLNTLHVFIAGCEKSHFPEK